MLLSKRDIPKVNMQFVSILGRCPSLGKGPKSTTSGEIRCWGEIPYTFPSIKCAMYKALISVSFQMGILWCCFFSRPRTQRSSTRAARLFFFHLFAYCRRLAFSPCKTYIRHIFAVFLAQGLPHRRFGDELLRGGRLWNNHKFLLISTSASCITNALLSFVKHWIDICEIW
jgi:hypothetical protein